MADGIPKLFVIVLSCVALFSAGTASAQPIAVRHREGLVHGFLVLSTLEGDPIAQGDLSQVSRGDRVTSHLVFRFKDGSIHDETAVFSQRGNFRLLNYHLEQKGPTFRTPIEMSIDTSSNQVTVHSDHNSDNEDRKQNNASDKMQLPSDLVNGLIFTVLKNVNRSEQPITASMVVATPKPRLVKLSATPQSEEEPFMIGDSKFLAIHYVIKVKLGGVTGAIAPILGKKPPDLHVWILGGEAPAFVKSEGPLFVGGPVWRIELTSPVWPHTTPGQSGKKQQN